MRSTSSTLLAMLLLLVKNLQHFSHHEVATFTTRKGFDIPDQEDP